MARGRPRKFPAPIAASPSPRLISTPIIGNGIVNTENSQTQVELNSAPGTSTLADFIPDNLNRIILGSGNRHNVGVDGPIVTTISGNLDVNPEIFADVSENPVPMENTVPLHEPVAEPVIPDNMPPSAAIPPVDDVGITAAATNTPVLQAHNSWKTVVTSTVQGMDLEYLPGEMNQEEIDIDIEDIQEEIEYWKFTLVGNVLGAKPTVSEMQDLLGSNGIRGGSQR